MALHKFKVELGYYGLNEGTTDGAWCSNTAHHFFVTVEEISPGHAEERLYAQHGGRAKCRVFYYGPVK